MPRGQPVLLTREAHGRPARTHVIRGYNAAAGERLTGWSVVGGRWWSVGTGWDRWLVVGGRWSVVGGRWSVVGEDRPLVTRHRSPATSRQPTGNSPQPRAPRAPRASGHGAARSLHARWLGERGFQGIDPCSIGSSVLRGIFHHGLGHDVDVVEGGEVVGVRWGIHVVFKHCAGKLAQMSGYGNGGVAGGRWQWSVGDGRGSPITAISRGLRRRR